MSVLNWKYRVLLSLVIYVQPSTLLVPLQMHWYNNENLICVKFHFKKWIVKEIILKVIACNLSKCHVLNSDLQFISAIFRMIPLLTL